MSCCSELFVVPLSEWHQIRGAQMVATMKVVSLSFDVDQGRVNELPSMMAFLGYILHPGSVVFGPWVSYTEYANHDLHAKKAYVSILSTQLVYFVKCCCG